MEGQGGGGGEKKLGGKLGFCLNWVLKLLGVPSRCEQVERRVSKRKNETSCINEKLHLWNCLDEVPRIYSWSSIFC